MKVTAIQSLKTKQKISELRSILGSINHYGKFVKNMRNLRNPLDDLLKKENAFNWSPERQESLDIVAADERCRCGDLSHNS